MMPGVCSSSTDVHFSGQEAEEDHGKEIQMRSRGQRHGRLSQPDTKASSRVSQRNQYSFYQPAQRLPKVMHESV